jgi:predicted transposase YbfD/YdcC
LLDHLAETGQLKGALVSIDAMGCQVAIDDKIVEHEADYLLALKGNQPTLEAEVADYFRSAPAEELVGKTTIEKAHGRIETRTYTASSKVGVGKLRSWISPQLCGNLRVELRSDVGLPLRIPSRLECTTVRAQLMENEADCA